MAPTSLDDRRVQPTPEKQGDAWLNLWLDVDYSWAGLLEKESWTSGPGNLQDFLREVARVDDHVIECGKYGLYHVLFIPPEWAREENLIPLSEEELLSRQSLVWESLRSSKLREPFAGSITGVHLSSDAAQILMNNTRASFEWVSFQGAVGGIVKQFNRSFGNCLFKQNVVINGKIDAGRRPKIGFSHCDYIADVIIDGIEGDGDVHFDTCSVSGLLEFENLCEARVRFDECILSTFDSLGCTFRNDIDVFETVISDRLSLARCTFDQPFSFVSVDLNGSLEILDCDFKSRVTLTEMSWPAYGRLVASAEGSKFYSTVSLSGHRPPPVQFFHNAEFTSAVAFPSISDRDLRAAFISELTAPGEAGESNEAHSSHAKTVESGCRALRKLAEQRGDVHLEHFWHRAEIIARRLRGDTSAAERHFSFLYGLFADYGLSISRPFIALGMLTALLALIYAWLGGPAWVGFSVNWASIEEGLGFSLNRTIPIGVFGDDVSTWRKDLLGSGGELMDIGIRTLATVQSIASAVLIYLGVMAVRRKFRIS